ncbi:hypothetical protein EVAR_97302_1 [Eumeta japonica]|uniref:Uncharacterized protein n=1 Tax=Eumeta variegata TaxID=151549 RepID=A0A4C1XFI9_EUMVA|nr:hypothetical protein EVAR_97302_1 [Eumeta japonica]
MAYRRKCHEDGRPSDRPTAYYATEAKTPGTGGGMADQGAILGRTDRSLRAHGRSGGTCYPPEQSRAEHAASTWYALCSASQRKKIQAQQNTALRMIVGAGRYVLNDVITRDLCIETVEEFIQRIARRMFDIADQGPYECPPEHRTNA